MADNTVLSAHTTTGDTLRDVDRTGVKTPVVGIDLNIGGAETLMAGAMPVTGTFWQATQPVSGTFFQVTQPVSGTVAATQSGTWTMSIDAGSNVIGHVIVDSGTITTVAAVTAITNPLPAGSNVIGHVIVDSGTITTVSTVSAVTTVSTVTTVGAVTAITNALPAGTNLLGQMSNSAETATVFNGTTACTPKFAAITASTSGATTIVALVGGKRIRVLRWSLSSNGSVNIKWQSHVSPTDLTGLHYMVQFASAGGAYCPQGIFQTISGEALDINLSASVAVGGELTYIEV